MLNPLLNIPDQPAQLKDGRPVTIRHGRAGDALAIARLIAPAFRVYVWAAWGNVERASQKLAQELDPDTFVVAVSETGEVLGATRISGRYKQRGKGWGFITQKFIRWGPYGLMCFGLKEIYNHLFERSHRLKPDELLKSLAAVDVHYRSLGIAEQEANFIEDYARAAGYASVCSRHLSTNAAVLAVQRKRGCVLTEEPPTLLAKLFRYPAVLKSTQLLAQPSTESEN